MTPRHAIAPRGTLAYIEGGGSIHEIIDSWDGKRVSLNPCEIDVAAVMSEGEFHQIHDGEDTLDNSKFKM